jgi:glycyl-tRNA synthetase beta chain
MTTQNLLVELFVEELPPKALKKLGQAFATQLAERLAALGLLSAGSQVKPFSSPRRLAAHITEVSAKALDKAVQQKLMPVSVGLSAAGAATPALLKKLQALGVDVSDAEAAVASLRTASDGKTDVLFYDSTVGGATLEIGLQSALEDALAKMPIPKVMSYQLDSDCDMPGWTTVQFVRPAHGLVALHGDAVVPVKVLGLHSGQVTQGHRFEAAVSPVWIAHADSYAETLLADGAVLASFDDRRFAIVQQLAQAAERLGPGFEVAMDEALLDEVTALVERPNVLTCSFEEAFLAVPQECLILTMKANQKYFPLLDAQSKLTNRFLVVSNITPQDPSDVIGGNERVVRPRLSDAKFFFDQDRKKSLESRVAGLDKVVYHNRLGTQGERMARVCALAKALGNTLGGADLAQAGEQAARLAKADLLTDMVGEFPELQGIMGAYYALHDGLSSAVAGAIEDHYKPRFAGDSLPRDMLGLVVAMADKLETLVGMFGIGNLPTGDKDPFALRRHALGVIRMLTERNMAVGLNELQALAAAAFAPWLQTQAAAEQQAFAQHQQTLQAFIYERLAGSLREQGYSALEVDAVLALRPQDLGDVPKRLAAVRVFAALPEAQALAAANKRIANILKKAGNIDPHVSTLLLQESAEIALHASMQAVLAQADAQFEAGDYTASLQTLAALRTPVDAFFDGVMVNAEAMDVRLNRQGLLKALHLAMNRVADLSRLAA